jgi:3-methyl-2-oxobutanoate hydroxymethyltransferase
MTMHCGDLRSSWHDILCVSYTGGMILLDTRAQSLLRFDEVMMMAKAIDRGLGLRMVDMPYRSFLSPEEAVENAGRRHETPR